MVEIPCHGLWRRLDEKGIRFDCGRCGACCGPHFVSDTEQDIILQYLASYGIHERKYESLYHRCPYFQDNSCLIYPVRPLICRLMRLTLLMPCPRGHKPDKALSEEEAIGLIEDIMKQ